MIVTVKNKAPTYIKRRRLKWLPIVELFSKSNRRTAASFETMHIGIYFAKPCFKRVLSFEFSGFLFGWRIDIPFQFDNCNGIGLPLFSLLDYELFHDAM